MAKLTASLSSCVLACIRSQPQFSCRYNPNSTSNELVDSQSLIWIGWPLTTKVVTIPVAWRNVVRTAISNSAIMRVVKLVGDWKVAVA
jgi:hypothetical protein